MRYRVPLSLLLLSLLCAGFLQLTSEGGQKVGICYGQMGGNQPPAHEAVELVQSVGIQRMRLYGPDHSALEALKNTGIEVVLGVPNEHLHMLSSGQDGADQWVQEYVKNYQDVKFRYIVVGNGIAPLHAQNSEFAEFLLPAMQNIKNAISASGLQDQIKVTTALDQSEILSQSSPPSAGEFRPDMRDFIDGIINFLVNNNAPLLVNIHPYFSYIYYKDEIPHGLGEPTKWFVNPRLKYALFQQTQSMVRDGSLGYTNVFDAMVDSVYSALEKANGSSLDVVVSEIGWPTAGAADANRKNAAAHNNNLINHVRNNGTPKRPHKSVETYIYSLFDENGKSPEVNKHWGVFWNNKQAKYEISFQG
ncbi:hypothetical protein DCAR_0207043 [Daucus carota subsp. sativus]|uniref:Glucan endo-1,3-beta-D-glucosidase n=1 Tax=Daucus carota subsp. sativus TaxID=79200 RepID=A0AAF1APP3_DAUCS|nr:hypothetical protein DCAR_0207043 [Daucus carota subsp. sativus]